MLEQRLALDYEVSVIVARGRSGASITLPVQENEHRDGILAVTTVPAPSAPAQVQAQAVDAARRIAEQLGYVGVLCVEFFVLEDGTLVANEMAPRPQTLAITRSRPARSRSSSSRCARSRACRSGSRSWCGPRRCSTCSAICGSTQTLTSPASRTGPPCWRSRREPAPLRQDRAPTRPEDGAPHDHRRGRCAGGADGPAGRGAPRPGLTPRVECRRSRRTSVIQSGHAPRNARDGGCRDRRRSRRALSRSGSCPGGAERDRAREVARRRWPHGLAPDR